MKFRFWKSVVITAVIMGLLVWVYVLADSYLYAAAEILNGILVVAGFVLVSLLVFLIVYAEPERRRGQIPPWDVQWQQYQR